MTALKRTLTLLKALMALLALMGLLVGIPALLIALAPLQVPTTLPDWEQILQTMTRPDDGSAIITLITLIAWAGWASFALSVLLEAADAATGIRWTPPTIRGLGIQRQMARGLIGAILLTTPTGLTATAVAAPTNPDPVDIALASINQTTPTTTVPADNDPGAAATSTEDHQEADIQPATHTVQPGESLWTIADTDLGDATRWGEIADLNQGVQQDDGRSLQDPSLIQPGWTLTLPDTATTGGQASQETTEQDKDTHVDDSARGGEETSASDDVDQAEAGSQARAGDDVDGQARAQTRLQPLTGAQAGADVVQDRQAADTDDTAEQTEETAGWVDMVSARTVGGVGSALALSLLGVLAWRRRHGQHGRPLGQRMAAVDPEDSILEAQLRQVADPVEMATVDRALRALGATGGEIPDIRAARMRTDAFELYLHSPADLPDPWEGSADRMVWTICGQDLPNQQIDAPAPFPSLVTLGADAEGAQVLVDLEHLGTLGLTGDSESTMAAMAAMATELALSPWADDLQVTLVGLLPELADALDTGRIRYVDGIEQITGELTRRAEQVAATLDQQGMTLPQARTQAGSDTWSPEIVLVPQTITTDQARQLDQLVAAMPRVGIAMVTDTQPTDGDEQRQWVLALNDDTALLQPAGLTIHPQLLTPADYGRVLSLLQATTDYVPGPTWTRHLPDLDEPSLDEAITAAAAPTNTDTDAETEEAQPLSQADNAPEAEEGQDTDGQAEAAAVVEITARPRADLHDVTIVMPTPIDTETVEEEQLAPALRLLGPVALDDAAGTPPASSERQRVLEIITLLALSGTRGIDTNRLDATLWAGREVKRTTRNSQLSRARRWLGTNPDGDNYLPMAATTPTGDSTWHLEGISTDWETFNQLIGPDPTTTPLRQLTKALDLVTGTPLTGSRRTHFAWADDIRQDMISTITDVAHVLAVRAIKDGHPIIAAHAARQALQATKDDERIWRSLIIATDLTGKDPKPVIEEMTSHFTDLDIELDEATLDLIEDINHPHAVAANQ